MIVPVSILFGLLLGLLASGVRTDETTSTREVYTDWHGHSLRSLGVLILKRWYVDECRNSRGRHGFLTD